MGIQKLPKSLLRGRFLHCRPVESGPIVRAHIFSIKSEVPLVEKVIVCPARKPCSKCELREGDFCCWYKGDGFGYTIIGPEMDKKSDRGYKNI